MSKNFKFTYKKISQFQLKYLMSKNGTPYLKINYKNNPTILIFDNQDFLIEYIAKELKLSNPKTIFLCDLYNVCCKDNYNIFLEAFKNRDRLRDDYYNNSKNCSNYEEYFSESPVDSYFGSTGIHNYFDLEDDNEDILYKLFH